jgi:hypothetical protein
MNVLSDLLEVTTTCIGDTVKQTHEPSKTTASTPGEPQFQGERTSPTPPPRPEARPGQ